MGDGKLSFKPCKHCQGLGCDKCNYTGFDVEVISKYEDKGNPVMD